MDFKVSVVIPFYNAKDYITQAVESALSQPETGEVLIVEDGSPDGGLEVCQRLAKNSSRVKLFRHDDGRNHGAAASRNLGIKKAKFPFIAFLDADDFFLPNRFFETVKVFGDNVQVDGVYEGIGAVFDNDEALEMWKTLPLKELTTVTKKIRPEDLFVELLKGQCGYFSPDGLTVRKELLFKVGLFNENLDFMEDTDMMFKLSALGKLYPGSIEKAVAVRRVHGGNRITYHLKNLRESYSSLKKLWASLYEWGNMNNLSKDKLFFLSRRYAERLRKIDYLDDVSFREFLDTRLKMLMLAQKTPRLLIDSLFLRMMLPSKQLIARKYKRKV